MAAASVRKSNPWAEIDLFSESMPSDGVFDRVHPLEKTWFRPKFEAILRSRFEKTIYLDADLMVMADLQDVFWLLDRFDMAFAHIQTRNLEYALKYWNYEIPNSFPQVNGGVIAIKKSEETQAFFTQVEENLSTSGLSQDQPILREMLLETSLSFSILPDEYNLRNSALLMARSSKDAAPRVLHNRQFLNKMRGLEAPVIEKIYGRHVVLHIMRLLAADRNLNPAAREKVYPLYKRFGVMKQKIRRLFSE